MFSRDDVDRPPEKLISEHLRRSKTRCPKAHGQAFVGSLGAEPARCAAEPRQKGSEKDSGFDRLAGQILFFETECCR